MEKSCVKLKKLSVGKKLNNKKKKSVNIFESQWFDTSAFNFGQYKLNTSLKFVSIQFIYSRHALFRIYFKIFRPGDQSGYHEL